MKKLFYLLSITFLMLQSCSSGSSDSNSNSAVTDIDGNVYQTVTICNQTWTKSNLNVSRYRNGDVIPQVTDNTQWAALTTGAWCYYNNDPANGAVYCKLYNWYAVNDPRGLAPVGYHIPTDLEWTTLTTCLGGESLAGGAMKEIGTSHWQSPNASATNSSSFTGLPGGCRSSSGLFNAIGNFGQWWSSSEGSTTDAWARSLVYAISSANRGINNKEVGFSMRCLRD